MKAFFEEYGFVLVSIVVVMLLVTMTSAVGGSIETKVKGIVDGFTFNATPAEGEKLITFEMPE